jgi:hypothetical protein
MPRRSEIVSDNGRAEARRHRDTAVVGVACRTGTWLGFGDPERGDSRKAERREQSSRVHPAIILLAPIA